jgi:hypothetical protein
MRNSGPFLVIRLSFTSRTKNSVSYFLIFRRGVCSHVWSETSHSQISHPHAGLSWPFSLLHPLPHSLSHTWSTSHTTPLDHCDSLDRLERKNKLTNIPPEKKDMLEGDPTVVLLMGFIRERGLTLSVRGVWSESNPYFFCVHMSSYNSHQLSITDTQLSTVGW